MNEADKIRMKMYEQQIEMLEKENKALRKELFKYKLKEGESKVDDSAQAILEKIRARRDEENGVKIESVTDGLGSILD